MLINWFTVIAQLVNFLILVWLLKRYLYKPILKAIDEREKLIASKIEDSEKKEKEATARSVEFKSKNEEFDKQRTALMNKAAEEGNTERQRLLEQARKDADVLSEKLNKVLKDEQEQMDNEISKRMQAEVFSIASKMMKELADKNLEEQVVQVFITKLKNSTEEEKKKMVAVFRSSDQTVSIRSAFDLNTAQQAEIERSVKELLQLSAPCKFETNVQLVSGIELNAGGYKLGWNISEYLAAVQRSIDEVINSKTKKIMQEKEVTKNANP
jgi:F-type H+-transporting ATPase subunit b